MADKQATPDAVVKKRESKTERKVVVGAFGRSFETMCDTQTVSRGIKAVWRNETGPSGTPNSKTAPA